MKPLVLRGLDDGGLRRDSAFDVRPLTKAEEMEGAPGYFLSNDEIDTRIRRPSGEPHSFIGIANPHSFHVLGGLSKQVEIGRAILVDDNPRQLRHWLDLAGHIRAAANRVDLVERLFQVRLGPAGREALAGVENGDPCFVAGAGPDDGFVELERTLWSDAEFDSQSFRAETRREVRATQLGLELQGETIGAIERYTGTVATAARDAFPHWPFTMAYGRGFLADEQCLRRMQRLLERIPVTLIAGDWATLLPELLHVCRYDPLLIWSSNVFCTWFVERHPPLEETFATLCDLATRTEPALPEIDALLFQDRRTARALPRQLDPRRRWRRRPLSIHTRTFRRVSRHLLGSRGLEVVNVPRWIEQDEGRSKLVGLDYLLEEDFLATDDRQHWDTIFIHVLRGHGTDEDRFALVLEKAHRLARRLVVLDHNRESRDFRRQEIGSTPEAVRRVIGAETLLEWLPGKRCKDRNFLMVYESG